MGGGSSCDNCGMSTGHRIVFVVGITIMLVAAALQMLFGGIAPGVLFWQVLILAVPTVLFGIQKYVKK